jgi:hypothetical protein
MSAAGASGNDITHELKAQAAAGRSAVEIATWLRLRLGDGATFFRFAGALFLAFKIPVQALRAAEGWTGFGWGGSLTDAELEELLSPLIPRSEPPRSN